MSDETVTIKKSEYDRMRKDQMFLECLEACGVDNWSEGYSEARKMLKEWLQEQNG